MVKYTQATDIGLVRTLNEDSILSAEPDCFVVADGMGGHVAGEIASNILTGTIERILSSDDCPTLDQDGLRSMIIDANKAILSSIRQHPEHQGMGTTATMLHLQDRTAFWAHVGDSRLYRLHHGEMQQLTDDHTYVAQLLASGSITSTEAEEHPSRHMLIRAVGVEEYVQVDTGEFSVENGDVFLLCSDGLTNMVTIEAVQAVLQAGDIADKAAALVEIARDGGGRDNISAIVVEYYEE